MITHTNEDCMVGMANKVKLLHGDCLELMKDRQRSIYALCVAEGELSRLYGIENHPTSDTYRNY